MCLCTVNDSDKSRGVLQTHLARSFCTHALIGKVKLSLVLLTSELSGIHGEPENEPGQDTTQARCQAIQPYIGRNILCASLCVCVCVCVCA